MCKRMRLLFCFAFIFFVLLSGCDNKNETTENTNFDFVYNKIIYDSMTNNTDHCNNYTDNEININDDKNSYETKNDYTIDVVFNITTLESRMATSNMHSMIIKPDGSLWGWGFNIFGELGNGTFMPINIPTQICANTDWTQVATGGGFNYKRIKLATKDLPR